MTPPAMTAAGRSGARAPAGRAGSAPGHRRQLRKRPAPSAPRRVSGPLVRAPRTAPTPRRSGALGVRALAVVRSLPEHSLVDRLVRGRAWIPVIGVLLVGIVAMQVEVLKLGTNAGRLLQRTTALQSQNESLQASVAWLGDDQRIEQLAAGMGMVMPAPTTITFLRAAPGQDPGRALANLHAPDPATFASELAAQAAAATASTQASATPSSTTSTSSTSGASGTSSTTGAATGASTAPTGPGTATTPTAPAPAQSATTQGVATTTATPTAPATPTTAATGAAAVAPTTSSQPSSSAGG